MTIIPELANLTLAQHLMLLWYTGYLTVKAALFLSVVFLWWVCWVWVGVRWYRRGLLKPALPRRWALRWFRKTQGIFGRIAVKGGRQGVRPGHTSHPWNGSIERPLSLADIVLAEEGISVKDFLGHWYWPGGEAVAVCGPRALRGSLRDAEPVWRYYVLHQGVLRKATGQPRALPVVLQAMGVEYRKRSVPVAKSPAWADKTEKIFWDREPTAIVDRRKMRR